jgi:glycosyltransferase involved in cell wall biosynthesis
MKISVALCTYNGEKYLQEQIESILAQSVSPDEIVICDDNSKDSTVQVLNALEKKYPSIIKIYQNKINLGFIKNFEKAFSLCKGEIIFFSDQDDTWHKDKILKFLNVFQANPDCSYVFSNAKAVNETGEELGYTLWGNIKFDAEAQKQFAEDKQRKILLKHNVVQGAAMAVRSSVKQIVLPFSESFFHDHWIALTLSMAYNNPGILLNESLLNYRMHSEQSLGLDTKKNSWIKRKYVTFCNLLSIHTEEFSSRIVKLEALNLQLSNLKIVPKENKDYITGLIYFYKTRNKMYSVNKIERFRLITELLKKGYYTKYSHSNLVAFKEMFEKIILH